MNDGAAAVERFLRRRIDEGKMPGAVWRIDGPRGEIAAGAVGRLGVRGPEPATLDTRYDLASLTKPLCTATVALLLQQSGRFDLAAPIDRWLPELDGSPYATRSAEELLSHRSRMPAWLPLYLHANDESGFLRRIGAAAPVAAEGELYSDLGYIALAIALQRAADLPLAELFERLVARPLELRRTTFGAEGEPNVAPTEQGNAFEARLAGADGAGHVWRQSIPPGQVHDANAFALGGAAGHAGLFGPADEVAAIALEILGGDRIGLDSESRRRLLSASTATGHRTLGWLLAPGSQAARDVLPDDAPGHVGFTGTSLWIDPRSERVFTLLTNRVHPTVADIDFQRVRLEFHRLAVRCGGSAAGPPPLQ